MAITSGFFDSIDGDRLYSAEQITKYFDGLVSDGVYESVGDKFAVSAGTDGMTVTVGSGRAIIRSHWVNSDSSAVLTLDPADARLNRTDFIVLRLDRANRTIELAVKKGAASTGDPGIAPPIRTASVWELYLAAVRINKGAQTPTYITDMRPSSYCGWVTGVVQQVDTSTLFTQWELAYSRMYEQFAAFMTSSAAEYNAWFSQLTHDLAVQAALKKQEITVDITEKTISVKIDIKGYDPSLDYLSVYINGKYIPAEDYSIFPAGDRYDFTLLTDWIYPGDRVSFVVLKNDIGGTAGVPVGISVTSTHGAVGVGGLTEVIEEEL